MYDLNDSPYLSAWVPYRGKFTFLMRFLLLILFFYGSTLLASLPATIGSVIVGWEDIVSLTRAVSEGHLKTEELTEVYREIIQTTSTHPAVVALNLLGQAIVAAAVIMYTVFIDRRRTASIGLAGGIKQGSMLSAVGAGCGILAPLAAMGILVATDAIRITGVYNHGMWLILYLTAFFVQAFAEEVMYRGFFLSLFLRPGRSPWLGIIVITLFYVMPYFGTDINAYGFINAALMGLLLCIIALRTGSIWFSTAFSALWNTMVVSVFGGAAGVPTIWRLIPLADRDMTSGGGYGMEGGLVVTLLLLVLLITALFIPSWKRTRPLQTNRTNTI